MRVGVVSMATMLVLLSSCGVWTSNNNVQLTNNKRIIHPTYDKWQQQTIRPEYMALLMEAEQRAHGKVKNVLAQARLMTLFQHEIIQGSCWDYLDQVFNRAGVPRQARKTVYKSTFAQGPYAQAEQLQTGDWLYYVNHNYHNNEHSGMFIGWVDRANYLGLMLSYAGEGRRDPARYRVYDLSSVYNIMRAQ